MDRRALRSGRYTQGQGCLRFSLSEGEDVFCCLGVLCDITNTPWKRKDLLNVQDWEAHISDNPNEHSSTNLPRSLRRAHRD